MPGGKETTPCNHNTIKSSESLLLRYRSLPLPLADTDATKHGWKKSPSMVDTTRVRSHEAHRAGVAPETEARRQRVCAEVVGDSGHVTAPTAAPEQHTVGEPSGSETLRRSAVEDNVSGPSLLLVVRHRSPGNNFIRFSFLKVSFVLCFFCLFNLANYREKHGGGTNRRTSGLASCCHKLCCYGAAGKHPTCCCSLSLIPAATKETQLQNWVLI